MGFGVWGLRFEVWGPGAGFFVWGQGHASLTVKHMQFQGLSRGVQGIGFKVKD